MTNNGRARVSINTHSNMTPAIIKAATPPRCDAIRPSDDDGEGPSSCSVPVLNYADHVHSHGAAAADNATKKGATRDSSDDGGHLDHVGALRGPLSSSSWPVLEASEKTVEASKMTCED